MNKKKKTLITIISIIVFLILFAIFIELFNTGYIFITDQTPEYSKKMIENKQEINFKDEIKNDWKFAILVTNENEEKIISTYIEKGLIDESESLFGLDSYLQQYNAILFIDKGKIVDTYVYDKRYYEVLTELKEIFYSDDCTFKIKKGIFKTTLEQI